MSDTAVVVDERLDLSCALRTLTLGPSDVVVIECDRMLTSGAATRIWQQVKNVVGQDRRVLILDAGLHIGVVRHAASLSETESVFQSPNGTGEEPLCL